MHHVRVVNYWEQNEDYSTGDSLSGRSEELLRRCRRKVIIAYDFSEGGTCIQAHILAEACYSLCRACVIINDYMTFPDTKRDARVGLIKSSLESIQLSENLFSLLIPEHRGLRSWLPTWISFRVCWRSVTTVASDFILVEADDKLQILVGTKYFGHLIQRANSLEKTLILGKIEGRRRRGQ